ncbi:hypothetical protein CVT26_008082 [Gymnopilus dilepis]|uniref:Uncharacterized protein n=1 Tax=Gymnopilus dilepis TaxID=231916 RepID=A0A409YJM3_9AGAR|nr:hypothetical protein CVT26_008082 [Gymnopilus dilepis]
MNTFSVAKYNSYPSIATAEALFLQQLSAAGLSLTKFLDQLSPLLLAEAHEGHYAACLIHRHCLLQEGERMVSHGRSTRPSRDISCRIVPERWLGTGEEVEHRFVDAGHPIPLPPSPKFLEKFRDIVERHNIDTIGVCYAPSAAELAPGFTFLESAGVEDRELVVDVVQDAFIPDNAKVYCSAWVPEYGISPLGGESRQEKPAMRCTHACIGCPP